MEIRKIIDDHVKWLNGQVNGKRANLSWANLRGLDLRGADLSRADLIWADLRDADLSGASLIEASLSGTDLRGADLRGAHLYGASLRGARLRGANLHEADLSGTNLSWCIPLYADTPRKFVLYALPEVKGGPRFIAGCWNFTLEEALTHWGPESQTSQPEYIAAIEKYLA